ncbi:hypothetical protein TrVFT333_004724 [Trichoderma virens FT-333]|nr:hypothetical protein TrVFT333_004724 [Trichoderma virens FT-333]
MPQLDVSPRSQQSDGAPLLSSEEKDSIGDHLDESSRAYLARRNNGQTKGGRRLISMACILVIIVTLGWASIFLIFEAEPPETASHSHSDSDSHDHGHSHSHSHSMMSKPAISNCGNSNEEAIAAGCYFDIFAFGWHSRECMDTQLYQTTLRTLEKRTAGAPVFYFSEGNQPTEHPGVIFKDIARLGDGSKLVGSYLTNGGHLYATWEHYLVACTYSWQKLVRAAMRNWPLDEWSIRYGPSAKCGKDLLSRERQQGTTRLSSPLSVSFFRCGMEASDIQMEIDKELAKS